MTKNNVYCGAQWIESFSDGIMFWSNFDASAGHSPVILLVIMSILGMLESWLLGAYFLSPGNNGIRLHKCSFASAQFNLAPSRAFTSIPSYFFFSHVLTNYPCAIVAHVIRHMCVCDSPKSQNNMCVTDTTNRRRIMLVANVTHQLFVHENNKVWIYIIHFYGNFLSFNFFSSFFFNNFNLNGGEEE